ALFMKALLSWEERDEKQAVDLAAKAAGIKPVDGKVLVGAPRVRAAAWALLGEVYQSERRFGQAKQAYEAALKMDPYLIQALLGNGAVLLEEQRYHDALPRFDAALTALKDSNSLDSQAQSRDEALIRAKIGRANALIMLDRLEEAKA